MIVLRAEGTRKVGIKGWTERRMGVWYPTRGQIGNRSDPHGKHRNDARPFLINRQPLFFLRPSLLFSPLLQNSPSRSFSRIEEIGRRSLGSHAPTHRVNAKLFLSRSFTEKRAMNTRLSISVLVRQCYSIYSCYSITLFSLSGGFHNAVKVSVRSIFYGEIRDTFIRV